MQWLSNYEDDLREAFTEAENILATMPITFSVPALAYLDNFNVFKKERSKNYICYLLPFWLQETTGVSRTDSVKFTVANIFGMMYYHLIDEIMDTLEAKPTEKLPLANLIYFEFTKIYSDYFPAGSPFWSYFKKYVIEWAEAVTHEKHRDFFYEDPTSIAHKAAPVKVSITSALLLPELNYDSNQVVSLHTSNEFISLHNKNEFILLLEEAVDTVLVTLQMLDDWKDWENDIVEGSYNCLISMVQAQLHIPLERKPTSEEIKQAFYATDLMSHYAQRAKANHEALQIVQPYAPHLYEFHEFLCDNVHMAAKQLENDRNLLYQGGLSYWIAKNT